MTLNLKGSLRVSMSNKVIVLPFSFSSKGYWLLVIGYWKSPLLQSKDNVLFMKFGSFLWILGIRIVKVKHSKVTLNPLFLMLIFLTFSYHALFFSDLFKIWNTSKSDY